MRINKADNVFQVYNKNSGVKKVKVDKTNKDIDQIKISEKAMDFQYALQKLKETDDIRMEKVDNIKKQIDAGTYHVDSEKIAERMIDSANFDIKI